MLNLRKRKLNFRKIPESPGVYIFWQDSTPIYVGKAINLKNRLRSYFLVNLAPKTSRMMDGAGELSFIRVNSELESLLLEARLIRKYQPRYNSAAKDDKHPLYIRITKEEYPRVITARKIEAKSRNLAFFGPFPSSSSVRSVLNLLRRIFPYSDHKLGRRACLYNHIGLCNPCPSVINQEKNAKMKKHLLQNYRKNIRFVKGVLSGRFSKVKEALYREMLLKSKNEEFEKAGLIKEQIDRLDYITQRVIPSEAFLQNPNLFEDVRRREINELTNFLSDVIPIKRRLFRIECFDVAHLAGGSPTASMVTFINGEQDKSFYRHFRIRQKKGADDISSMREVAKRRSKHFGSWGTPDLIMVDGGKTQVSVFYEVLKQFNIPIVGLEKRFEILIIPVTKGKKLIFIERKVPKGSILNLVQRMRNEAHRFARRYHHHLIRKSLIPFS